MKRQRRKNMKILQAMHFPLEGAGTGHYVHNLSVGLTKKGHSVGVVYAQSPNCQRYGTPYKRFPIDFEKGDLDFPFPVFESHPLGSDLTFGSISSERIGRYMERFEQTLNQAIEDIKPDVINVHHGWLLGSMLSRKGIPYFATLHGTELKAFDSYPAYQHDVLKGLSGAQGVITLTEDQREKAIQKYGLDKNKFSIISTGVDTDFFSPMNFDKSRIFRKNQISTNGDRPIVLYVGRLTEVKGVEYLVEAAATLKEERDSPKILVVGDGILKKQLMKVKKTYGLSDLNFLGLKDSKDILELYNATDLVVVPSLSEGFPLVPAESMACGTPFIATDIPGGLKIQATKLEEVVQTNMCQPISLRVPVKNPLALASKIDETLALKLKKRMRRHIRKVASEFSLDKMVTNTSNTYSGIGGA